MVLALVAAGCGGAAHTTPQSNAGGAGAGQPKPNGGGNGPQQPTPHGGGRAPSGVKANPAAVAVIRAWSQALRSGDVRGAARYFAVPSLLINGPGQGGEPFVTAIRSFSQAVSANASLPCGAQLISTRQRGRYVNALFRLTDRPGAGGGCGQGAGATARTNFLIRHGRIVEWIRAPSEPGDGGGPGPGTPQV